MKITWITLRVRDLDASKKFYGELLGMEQSRAFETPDGRQFTFFTDGQGMEVELICGGPCKVKEKGLRNPMVSFGFQTEAYESILAAAQKGGLDVNGPLVLGGHMECFFVEDPDGFQVQVIKA